MAAYLTKWRTAETLLHGAMAGAFFETFVVGEIKLSARVRPEDLAGINYLRAKFKNVARGAVITAGQASLPLDRHTEIIPAGLIS